MSRVDIVSRSDAMVACEPSTMWRRGKSRAKGTASPFLQERVVDATLSECGKSPAERSAIGEIHGHCAVFTRPEIACGILDIIGWKADHDITGKRLLEPSCGDGSFLVPAVERLLQCAKRRGVLIEAELSEAIVAFEFDFDTASLARERVKALLASMGFDATATARLAARWVRCEDFLLAEGLGTFTHVVGNPPYMRWSKLPDVLRRAYETKMPAHAARGDLCLSFVWRATGLLEAKAGQVAFLCADRWLRCAYGAAARAKLAKQVRVAVHLGVHAVPVFLGARKVGAYAAITVLDRKLAGGSIVAEVSSMMDLQRRLSIGIAATGHARRAKVLVGEAGAVLAEPRLAALFERMLEKTVRLGEAGVTIRCGMALGAASAFVVDDDADIEIDRLIPFLRPRDLADDGSAVPIKRLADVWAPGGTLVELNVYPALKAHLERHRATLEARVCVVRPEQWYRTIDRVDRRHLLAPKILIAGMAKTSRVAWSPGGAQPSNALYAITSSDWPLHALYALFRAGVLDVFAAVLSPRFSGGSMRFDGNVLGQVRIPLWSSLDDGLKRALEHMDVAAGIPRPDLIAGIYDLRSAAHRRALEVATARPSTYAAYRERS